MIVANLVKKFPFLFTTPEGSLMCSRQVPRSSDSLINCELHDSESSMVAFAAETLDLDRLKSGGLHEKHASATWNLGNISAFA
jgi:hypothetical protein